MAKKLADSTIFNNLIVSDKLKNVLNGINFNTSMVSKEEITSEITTIEKRMNHPTKIPVMNLYNSGKIIIIDNKEVDIPTYLSVMSMSNKDRETFVLADITKHTTKNKSITVNILYALLQNALITYEFDTEWSKYTGNAAFIDISSIIYSQLCMKVVDKLKSINLHEIESDVLAFIFAKFFIINMVERSDSSTTDGMAYKSCFYGTDRKLIKEKEEELDADGKLYSDIITLFSKLNTVPAYKMSFRSFFENFIRMYGDSTVLAMDFLPAFYQMLFSTAVAGNLNKEYAIEKTVDIKMIIRCYSMFSRII